MLKDFKISDLYCSFLNFQITERQVFPNLNLFERLSYVTEKQAVVISFPVEKEKKFISSHSGSSNLAVLCLTLYETV